MQWTLTKIRAKIKSLTGRPDMLDTAIDEYINSYYQYHLPQEISGALELKTWFEATTANGVGEYLLDTDMISVQTPVTADGTRMNLYGPYSADTFFKKYSRDNEDAGEYTKPTDALQDDRVLYVRPIPDDEYIIKAAVYKRPSPLTEDTDTPLDDAWGPLICYFCAIEIYIDGGEVDEAQGLVSTYAGYKSSIGKKNIIQLTEQQAVPRW